TLAGAFFSNRASTSAHIARVFLTGFQRILPKTLKGMALTAGYFGRGVETGHMVDTCAQTWLTHYGP
ncbi:hypothetical protein, partial [Pseudomonas sp. 1]|uniref:hypothetical protein n=1 Tax=Pseudomonas sp. 1 TaxID=488747 RepID=UPI00209B33CD